MNREIVKDLYPSNKGNALCSCNDGRANSQIKQSGTSAKSTRSKNLSKLYNFLIHGRLEIKCTILRVQYLVLEVWRQVNSISLGNIFQGTEDIYIRIS